MLQIKAYTSVRIQAKIILKYFRKTKNKFPYWERLNFRDRDEWRGIAQLVKRERKYYKKLRKKIKLKTGDTNERQITRDS